MNTMNHKKCLTSMLLAVPVLLLIPLVAMQFSSQVKWSLADFIVMGVLLLGVVILIEFVIRKTQVSTRRFVYIALVVLLFLLVWAELAVGIFGSPVAGS